MKDEYVLIYFAGYGTTIITEVKTSELFLPNLSPSVANGSLSVANFYSPIAEGSLSVANFCSSEKNGCFCI